MMLKTNFAHALRPLVAEMFVTKTNVSDNT